MPDPRDPNVSVHARPEFRISEPGEVRKPEHVGVGYLVAPILGQTADAWTTYEALKKGFREGNPLMAPLAGKPAVFALAKVGAGFGFAWLTKRMADKGNARAARGFSAAATFLGVVPAVMNATTMARGR